jgi:ATP-binding cassette subfamily B protein
VTDTRRTLRKIAPYFAKHKGRIAAITALALSTSAIGAVEPLLMKYVFDALDHPGPASARAVVLGLLGLGFLLTTRELVHAVQDWFTWKVRIHSSYEMLRAAVDRLHALPLAYHRQHGVGALLTKIDRGIVGCVGTFTEVAFNVLPSVVYLAMSAYFMARLDWRLTIVVLAFAPLPAIIGARAADEQTTRERGLMNRWTEIHGRFNEILAGIHVVKSFTMEEAEKQRFLGDVGAVNETTLRGIKRDGITNTLKSGVVTLARIAALGVGAWLVVRHEISLGTVVAFLAYVVGLFGPVQALTGMYQTLRRGAVAVEALSGIVEAEDALGDAPDAIEPPKLRGEVEFRDVTFGYHPEQPIVQDLSLKVRAGETIALVGPSGSGKSTLMVLLQRLYDPNAGEVRVDGIDVRRFKQRSFRQHVGVVLQEGALFSGTIRENIAFGIPHATDEGVIAAAKAANAHDFVMRLPKGYDTQVGERGSGLSGGERQRLAIARAILKDPEILILDEPTSALDAESEALVQEALDRLVQGRTTFIIAHRLSTVTGADRIAVFHRGVIHEIGSHEELVARGGYYAKLVRLQLSGLTNPRRLSSIPPEARTARSAA